VIFLSPPQLFLLVLPDIVNSDPFAEVGKDRVLLGVNDFSKCFGLSFDRRQLLLEIRERLRRLLDLRSEDFELVLDSLESKIGRALISVVRIRVSREIDNDEETKRVNSRDHP
jgi:hypothetical protein